MMKRCYMILFESGLVKVGFANPLYYRIKEHKRQAEVHGNKVKRIWFSDPIEDFALCEQGLIMECSKSFERMMNEYFVGANEDMCDLILNQTDVRFSKCNDIVASKAQDSFFAMIYDGKNPDHGDIEKEKDESVSEAMMRILKILDNNKFLSDGVIKNRMRGYSKAAVGKAIMDLESMNKIRAETNQHTRTGREFKTYFLVK